MIRLSILEGGTLIPEAEIRRYDPLMPGLEITPSGTSLPYEKLYGPGFERLCYEILMAQGKSAQLFGKTGQSDYGADIISENEQGLTVYQCKNYTSTPSWTKIRNELLQFETKWLRNSKLPKPILYVLMCSQALDDVETQETWLRFKPEFEQRTGVNVEMRGQDYLNAQLRSRPDVVAGIFSGAWAEVFCGATGWQTDPWLRICRGQARHPSVSRFLQRHDSRLIYLAKKREQDFLSAMSKSNVVLVCGLPGTGKTVTTLELLTQLPGAPKPIYYATLLDQMDVVRLWQSAVRRSSMPSIFVLDDCHLNFAWAEAFVERLQPELGHASAGIAIVLLARSLAPETAEPDTDSELVRKLQVDKALVRFFTTQLHFLQVLEFLRPNFIGLSEERLTQLFHATGGDLALLDEALDHLKTPSDLDTFDHSVLASAIYRRYFHGRRMLPTLREISALAQFDLTPPIMQFEGRWADREREISKSLLTELFSPPRYRFAHSSLAELIFHSLVRLEATEGQEDQELLRHTCDALNRYFFEVLSCESSNSQAETASTTSSLYQVLRTQLKLLNPKLQKSLKVRLLADERMQRLLAGQAKDNLAVPLFVAAIKLLEGEDMPGPLGSYRSSLERKLDSIIASERLEDLSSGLHALKINIPSLLEDLQETVGPERFLTLFKTTGTVFDLFRILQHTTPKFAGQLLDGLAKNTIQALIDKTIASNRSIGTLSLAMRELRDTDENLLVRLESCIGAERFLNLIEANGTVYELFKTLEHGTHEFAGQLLDCLNEGIVQTIIAKTIASNRSIGTLDLAMRELRDTDENLLVRLERCIGAERFLNLIKANGTVFELFRVLQYATTEFAGQLLDCLNEEIVQTIIGKTIASNRAITTLHLTMRELKDTDETLLVRLEKCIGAEGFLNLIQANGTVLELFRILQYATSEFAVQLLDFLDGYSIQALIKKTVASGRYSMESTHFHLRALAKTSDLRERLQTKIGVIGWWCLLIKGGTLNSLSELSKSFSMQFRISFKRAAAGLSVSDWAQILSTSQFRNLCTFISSELSEYPAKAKQRFHQAVSLTVHDLVQRSKWLDLQTSSPPDILLGPEAVVVNNAFGQHINSATIDTLDGFDFLETVNAIALLWRERPDLREQLAKDLWNKLGNPDGWPTRKGTWTAIRLILFIAARSPIISCDSAEQLFKASCDILNKRNVLDEADQLPIFLLLWNLVTLSYERGLKKTIADVFTPSGTEKCLRLIAERAKKKSDKAEKNSLFALGGLLHFLQKDLYERLNAALLPLRPHIPRLVEELSDYTFLPEFFARRGIALVNPTSDVFSRETCIALLRKVDSYVDKGASIEALRQHVERYLTSRAPTKAQTTQS